VDLRVHVCILCVPAGIYGGSPVLAALDAAFLAGLRTDGVPSSCEYLAAIRDSAVTSSALKDSDDILSVGVVESGGKEATIARIVQALGWCVVVVCTNLETGASPFAVSLGEFTLVCGFLSTVA
jgi:hypothetical protein